MVLAAFSDTKGLRHFGAKVGTGMKSDQSLYREDLATYSEGDTFDHQSAVGFIKVWGLPIKTWRQAHPEAQGVQEAGLESLGKVSGLDG